jgi:hypothetical protein
MRNALAVPVVVVRVFIVTVISVAKLGDVG